MLAIKVLAGRAERARRYLKKHAMLDAKHIPIARNKFIYFPIGAAKRGFALPSGMKAMGAEIADEKFDVSGSKPSYRDMLRKELGGDYGNVARGYEVLGNIAIIEAEPRLARKVAHAVMGINSNVKTVLRKSGAVSGRYRVRRYAYVAGKRNYVAEYRENGAVLRFDVRKTFFSGKLSYERGRIAGLSKGRENVMVMFAGVGPFAIELAKRNGSADVIAIELNRQAYRAMLENIELNKAGNVTAVCGDVKKLANKYKGFADRIVMPLPKDSRSFLDSVIMCAKRECTVHYYAFVPSDGGTEKCINELRGFFSGKGYSFKAIGIRTVRPYAHDTIEIVVDFRIARNAVR